MPEFTNRQELPACVAFLNIAGIKGQPATTVVRAMTTLHKQLSGLKKRKGLSGLRVLSTLTGAIIIVPDDCIIYLHSVLGELAASFSMYGLPVRVGVSRGDLEVLEDADGRLNIIGPAINLAARIATATDNLGCLFHDDYYRFAKSFTSDHPLDPKYGSAISVRGKLHDPEIPCWTAPNYDVPADIDDSKLPRLSGTPPEKSGVVLAYDLPKFSAGDKNTISSRFRSVVDAITRLRANQASGTPAIFSPGGDGGLLLISGPKKQGFKTAQELVDLLAVETDNKDPKTAVRSRVGLHYGRVSLFKDAEGNLRPTGPVCFVADEIGKGVEAGSGVVISGEFADIVTEGDRKRFAIEYSPLSKLVEGPARGIARFQRARNMAVFSSDEAAQSDRIAEARRRAGLFLEVVKRHPSVAYVPERTEVERFFFDCSGTVTIPLAYHWRNTGVFLHWVDYCLLTIIRELKSIGFDPKPLVTIMEPDHSGIAHLRDSIRIVAGMDPIFYHEIVTDFGSSLPSAENMGIDREFKQRVLKSPHLLGPVLGNRVSLDWICYLIMVAHAAGGLVMLIWDRHREIFEHIASILPVRVLLILTKDLHLGGQIGKIESPGKELVIRPPDFPEMESWLRTAPQSDIDHFCQLLQETHTYVTDEVLDPSRHVPAWSEVESGVSEERSRSIQALQTQCAYINGIFAHGGPESWNPDRGDGQ